MNKISSLVFFCSNYKVFFFIKCHTASSHDRSHSNNNKSFQISTNKRTRLTFLSIKSSSVFTYINNKAL